MKKIKAFLAFALAVSMCVSTGCGKSGDSGEKDDTEKEVTTSAAESVAEETNSEAAQAESVAETEAGTTSAEAEETGETTLTNDLLISELEPYISEIAGKDIDTAEKIIKDLLSITSTRTEAGPYLDNWMYYEWEMPKDITIGGVHFDDVALTTTDNAVDSFSLGIEYEDKYTAQDERSNIRYDLFGSQGYNKVDDNVIDENPELLELRRAYILNCGYASVDIDMGNDKRVLIQISKLH